MAGYDPVYGARPLKRAIQKQIADPLAQRILAGEFREGEHILVDADAEGVLNFRKQEQNARRPCYGIGGKRIKEARAECRPHSALALAPAGAGSA